MGDHIYAELADNYAASSASAPPNALYDRPTIMRLLGPVQGAASSSSDAGLAT